MKKILLSLFVLAVIGFTGKVQAQCTVSDIVIDVNSCNDATADLVVNFDVSFKILNNSGNKWIFIHSWKASQYPNYWNCSPTGTSTENKPPKNTTTGSQANTALANAFLNIAIDNNGAIPLLVSTYNPDPTNVTITPVAGISKVINGDGSSTITLTGVQITIPGIANCTDVVSVKSDVWSSQASTGQVVHCVNCGIAQIFNDPILSGFKPCVTPRRINFGVVSFDVVPVSFTYQIYRDNGNNSFDGGDVNVSLTAPNADVITINTQGVPGQQGRVVGFVGDNAPGENSNYWVVVTKVGAVSGVAKLYTHINGCASLPVDFKSFTATRNRSNVLVKWETSSEQNNSGFAVERNINGSWEQVAFVPSQAANGNSTSDLSYQFTDLNNTKGITQYRIKQVDFDSKSKYSEIRSVRGDGQKGRTIVYPNPSSDGKINVVFEDANVTRDISVTDMAGRTVKQMKGVTNNNITIDNLTPGMYTLRVFVPATGDQTVEKIMVNKR